MLNADVVAQKDPLNFQRRRFDIQGFVLCKNVVVLVAHVIGWSSVVMRANALQRLFVLAWQAGCRQKYSLTTFQGGMAAPGSIQSHKQQH